MKKDDELEWEQLSEENIVRCAKMMLAPKEIAAFCGVSMPTLTKFCKETLGRTVGEIVDSVKIGQKLKLIEMAEKAAEIDGATLRFLLKNWCGYSDKNEVVNTTTVTADVNLSNPLLAKLTDEKRAQIIDLIEGATE